MSEPDLELAVAWQRHVAPDRRRLDGLLARHRERHRRYHTVAHVALVIRHVEELARTEPVGDLDAVVAAAFYHDAVYEPTNRSNERASAGLARRDLAELAWADGRIDDVADMIEATTHDDVPPTGDAAVLVDADLAVLGADPSTYASYRDGVRQEYRHVDDAAWRVGRTAVLRGLLERDSIYATPTGRERWERRARANLTAELSDLG